MTSAVSERNGAQYIDVSVKILRDIDEFQAMIYKKSSFKGFVFEVGVYPT